MDSGQRIVDSGQLYMGNVFVVCKEHELMFCICEDDFSCGVCTMQKNKTLDRYAVRPV